MIPNNSVKEVVEVLRRHLDDRRIREILDDLALVEGNLSYRMTIRALRALVAR